MEQEIFVNFLPHIIRELVIMLKIFLISKSLVAIVAPLVLKKRLELAFKVLIETLIPVVSHEHSEESVELITFIQVFVVRFELV